MRKLNDGTGRLVTAIFLAAGVAACVNQPGGIRTGKLSPSEQMMWSTYAVGTQNAMATCFVVTRKNPHAPGGVTHAVVTSVHVLKTLRKGPLYLGVRFADEHGQPQVAILSFSPQSAAVPRAVRHPQHDIAAFEVQIPADVAKRISLPSFLAEAAIGRDGDQPRVGEEVSVLGFPDVYPGTSGAFPVLRGGKIASYSGGMSHDPHRFMINANVYPGDSGGPVFTVRPGGHPRLVGMVTQRVGVDPTRAVPLAVAVDAGAIRETLQLLDRATPNNPTASKTASQFSVQVAGTRTPTTSSTAHLRSE